MPILRRKTTYNVDNYRLAASKKYVRYSSVGFSPSWLSRKTPFYALVMKQNFFKPICDTVNELQTVFFYYQISQFNLQMILLISLGRTNILKSKSNLQWYNIGWSQ